MVRQRRWSKSTIKTGTVCPWIYQKKIPERQRPSVKLQPHPGAAAQPAQSVKTLHEGQHPELIHVLFGHEAWALGNKWIAFERHREVWSSGISFLNFKNLIVFQISSHAYKMHKYIIYASLKAPFYLAGERDALTNSLTPATTIGSKTISTVALSRTRQRMRGHRSLWHHWKFSSVINHPRPWVKAGILLTTLTRETQ